MIYPEEFINWHIFGGREPFEAKERKGSQDFQAQGVARSDLQGKTYIGFAKQS